MSPNAAQYHRVSQPSILHRRGNYVGHRFLLRAVIWSRHVRRHQEERRPHSGECLRQCTCVSCIRNERLRALLRKRLQLRRAAPHDAYLLALFQ